MTDPSLSPDREEAVRRLLGSVATEAPPLPEDVARRLDRTLTDLTAERTAGGSASSAPVVDLARRRRRRVGALFLAAASVVVALGVAVPLRDTGDHRVTTATDQGADRTTAGTATGSQAPGTFATGPSADVPQLDGARAEQDTNRQPLAGVPVLHRARLRADLLALRRTLPPTTYESSVVRAPGGFTCADARFGKGRLVAVRYAGAPAVAAFRAPMASTQVAEVLQCGTAAVLGSVTLPPPR